MGVGTEPRAETPSALLGWAIHDGADEIAEGVLARLEVVGLDRRTPGPHVYEAIAETDRLSARILGRWLATGDEISADEGRQLSALGDLVGEVCLPGLVKAYLAFRDVATDLIEREAARLGSPGELREQAVSMMSLCLDGTMVSMCRRFDDERIRLASELVAEQAKLEHQALHDPLTGLANRSLLQDQLDQAIERAAADGTKVGLLFVDLDGFKTVNDNLGHDAGDRLLREVADRFNQIVRPGDIVARLGGDEFVVLCQGLERGLDQVEALGDRLLASLEHPCDIAGRDVQAAASVGVACTDGHGDGEDLLNSADAAMYMAKERGGSRQAHFDRNEGMSSARQAKLRFGLRHAVQRGEMSVDYQAIVGADGHQVVSVEALARWHHPELGAIEPSEFIPLAEESGAIRGIDEWILSAACTQAARWHDRGWHLGVSVNLSGQHLEADRLEQTVRAVLAETGLPATALTLELTESRLMADPESVVRSLRHLADIGVKLAIDDFGVGYSSLAYLQRLPIDSVKIDRSFIQGLGEPGQDSSVVEAIMTLAHSLGLTVVAEGVENDRELAEVQRLGCDEIQGFALARPAPPEAMGSLRRP